MSMEDLQRLIKCFQEAQHLNDEALRLLDQGSPLEGLEGLFEAKAKVLADLAALDLKLLQGNDEPAALALAFQAQSRCARSETLLAEALGARRRLQNNVSQVTQAYSSKPVDNLGTKGLDLAS